MSINVVRVASLCLLCGCASFAGRQDYTAYRDVRLASAGVARIEARLAYIEAHPSGRWASEMQAELVEAEEPFYNRSQGSAEALAHYVALYPEGRFVAEAQARLAALDVVQERRGEEASERLERENDQREQTLLARRQWAAEAVTYWSRVLMGVSNWGAPMNEVVAANPAFNEAFVAEPRPRCSDRECAKFYTLSYAIRVPGQTQITRTLDLILRLHLEEGRLMGAELLMPHRGFSRWYELENQQFVPDMDPESRQATMEWALVRIVPILREIAPEAVAVDVVPEPILPVLIPEDDSAGENGEDDNGENAETDVESLVLPLALMALRTETVDVVVFAAADEDETEAYDGFLVRLRSAENEAAIEALEQDLSAADGDAPES